MTTAETLDPRDIEVRRLRRSMNDLLSAIALPAMWSGSEPPHIARTLLEALRGMLHLDLAYIWLNPMGETAAIEAALASPGLGAPEEAAAIGADLRVLLDVHQNQWRPSTAHGRLGAKDVSVATARLGLSGEVGVLVGAAARPDFPDEQDKLLLNVFANQGVLALREARLRAEQALLAKDLDRRVALRTQELTDANDALNRVRSELAHAARAMSLGVLTASIAHEVNQPLSGIITNANTCLKMLASDPPDIEGVREAARRTIRDGNRASEVISRLRALFGHKDFGAESIDLNEAAREVVALSMHEMHQRSIDVRLQTDEDAPSVIGDRVQVQQVILNLLLNASDALETINDRPREILLSITNEGLGARVTVQDTGPGIAADALAKLFDAFYTTKPDGMGIGLSVSRSIIERHNGQLSAKPNDGPGASFSFFIPSHPPTFE